MNPRRASGDSAALSELSDTAASPMPDAGRTLHEVEKDLESGAVAAAILNHQDDKEAALVPAAEPVGAPTLRIEDWDGPDDPENPINWSTWSRWYHTIVSGLIAFCATAGSSIYAPATVEVKYHFSVSLTAAILPLSLYVVALGLGPVLAAPMSETYGRRIVFWVSGPLSMFFTLGAGFSQTFASLLICRTLAGAFAAPVLAVGSGVNADMFPPEKRAAAAWGFLVCPFMASSLGPLIGGYIVTAKGWRWTQWLLLMMSLFCFILSLFMKETYKKTILTARARKRGLKPPSTAIGNVSALVALKVLFTVTLFRPVQMLISEPIVTFVSIYVSFNFGVLFVFITAFPLIFERSYAFDLGSTGLAFLGIAIAIPIAGATGIVSDRLFYRKQHILAIQSGKRRAEPEHRLYAAMMGSVGIPIGLFWFAWTAGRVTWISCILASAPFAWGNAMIFGSTALYMIDVYGPLLGASAMAANGLSRYAFAGAFPLFTDQMYEKMGIAWATSLFGFVSLAMMPIPWVFYKFGPSIRERSRLAVVQS